MSNGGLRDWRGEIIQAKVAAKGGEGVSEVIAVGSRSATDDTSLLLEGNAARKGNMLEERQSEPRKTLRKDEFGRDVEVVVDGKRHHKCKDQRREDRKKEKKHKHKHKKHKHRRDKSRSRSRSKSPQGRLVGTPPPPDPFRPQLDERRYERSQRHQRERSRSRGRRDARRTDRSQSRGPRGSSYGRHRRQSFCRSRSRSRGKNRSRSPPSSRSGRRRSSASAERKWTHNAFDDRSPSPQRQVDPMYRPEPEDWVSRAGGVYLPRK